MKYSSGPQVPTMPKAGPDLVRSRVGDARCCPKPRTDFTLITRKPRLESGPLVPTARVP